MDFQLHEYQRSILRELLFHPLARFRDLKKIDIPNDHFNFHIKQLIAADLVIKINGKYNLSPVGKEYASHLDTDSVNFERQAKIGVAIHAMRTVNGQLETLAHQRLKQPFYGWWGSHSGKIRWGENPYECAIREFSEETGLTGEFVLKGILHYLNLDKTGKLLEDKYFFLFYVSNTSGILEETLEEGRNKWVDESEYRSFYPHSFGTWDGLIEFMNQPHLVYSENKTIVEDY